jgi:hypothetical protein
VEESLKRKIMRDVSRPSVAAATTLDMTSDWNKMPYVEYDLGCVQELKT